MALNVRYIIVAGGGGGGSDMGGGGGAGGFLSSNTLSLATGTSYAVTVGAGGAGAPPGISQVRGTNGQNSSAFGLTAIGGGGGASEYGNNSSPAGNGGSGGGVAGSSSTTYGTGTAGQGNNGGSSGGSYYPGGGGGAGAAGSNTPANGGVGVQDNILGTSYYWAAGGGGAGYSGIAGNGGLGGGGGGAPKVSGGGLAGTGGLNAGVDGEVGSLGSQTNKKGGAGGTNTGSGGGGGSHYNLTNDGGSGGSGIVAITYVGAPVASGGTITTVGANTVHTFYSSGVFTPYSPGLTANTSTAYWGDTASVTFFDSTAPNGTTVAYTISGVTSSEINGASTTGNFTLTSGVGEFNLTFTPTAATANTVTISAGGYTATINVTFLVSLTGSVGASWGANLTYTATTRGLSNNAIIPYTISGSNITSAQLSGFPLTGTFNSIKTAYLGSTYFDGTGDYLSVTNGAPFQFGTGDFTVECWIKTTDQAFDIINQYTSGGTNWSWLVVSGSLYWQNSNAAASLYYIGLTTLTTNPTSGSWTHIAITRNGGTLKYWINGVGQSSTIADGNNYAGSASEVRIGAGYYGDFQGNISNLRVVKGVAVYTGNFTPSTSPLSATQSASTNVAAITGSQTSLLTCNRQTSIIDSSTNAYTITTSGNAAANTEYPSTYTSDGNSLNIGTGTLVVTTNSSAPILSSANGFITIGATTNSFTIRNPNPVLYGNVRTNQASINFVNTLTSDIHSQNVEAITSSVSNINPKFVETKITTTQSTPAFINTLTSDIHSQNVEGKTLTLSNISSKNVNTKITPTIQTIIPTATFAYSSGTEISANGNAISVTPTVTQTWYI